MKLLLLLTLQVVITTGVHYEAGYDHYYTYSSETDTLGMHNVTTVLKFRIRKLNETENGVKFHLLTVDSFIQHTQNGQYADNPFKWDLSKRFLFEMEPDGRVNFVHFHPEDKDEMVVLKKALVGTMSATIKIQNMKTWSFTSEEQDHGGLFEHTYQGQKTNTGFTFKRHHKSDQHVYRTHKRLIHLDHSMNIHSIEAHDNITMKGDEPTQRRTIGTPLIDDTNIKVFSTGEFPGISAVANTQVKLTLKRKSNNHHSTDDSDLVRDTIVVTKKPPLRTRLNETEENISKLINCVLSYQNKFAPNRTMCVKNLTHAVVLLHDDEFTKFSHEVLNRSCGESDIKCLERRYLMLDVIAQAKTNASQQIIVDYVLSMNISVEEVRRILVHSVAIKQPVVNLIKAVEYLCFGMGDKFHGNRNMSLTQKRSCLTLGALAKNLREMQNDTEAQRIVEKFETWIGFHNESEFVDIVKPREKRSVGQGKDYSERDRHIALKRTLLHSLGNAAHPRSLKHIASYLQLNKAHPEIRRTAAHALRHYTCNESAAHLLRSALFDSEDVVRHSAYEIYIEHPESKQLTKEQEDAVLEQRYTYPLITRVRRGTFADILKALSFHLGMPKFDWNKVIGSRKLGASFGMRMENFVDLHLEPFKGKFELKVDNLAFAEVNVGLIGQQYDIFRVSLCYKKKFKYNLNILKDFGFDDIQNLASAFDRIYHKIMDPIVDAVDTIKELIEMVKEVTFAQLVNQIVDLFKHLPDIIMKIVDMIKDTYKKLTDFDGFPLVNTFKKLVNRITTFISDIKHDVLEFYHSIADAMTVTLPFVGHEMKEGFDLIKSNWKFWENPLESFKGIEMALVKFKLAVATFIEAKNRIMDACFFTKGRTPYWFHPGEEIHGILHDLDEVLRMTTEELKDFFHPQHTSLELHDTGMSTVQITDGFNVSGTHSFIQLVIKKGIDVLKSELYGTLNIAKPFWGKISHLMDIFKKIKSAYTFLRDGIHKGKYYIQKLFGSKFHRNFPKIPAPCESSSCGCGELRKDSKGRLGLHLNFKRKIRKVVNPFHGTVYRKSDTEVLVQPVRADLAMYEVVVSGFDVNANFDEDGKGVFKRAGRQIGRAKEVNCESGPFVFVAIRKRPNATDTTKSEHGYKYIDPAPYLKKRFPSPSHNSNCNGFTYYYIGMATEEDDLTGEPDDEHEEIHRGHSEHTVPHFGKKSRGKRSAEEPEKVGWLEKFKGKFHNMTGKFDKYKNMFSKAAKSFLPSFDVNDKPLTFIKHLLEGSPIISQLDDIVRQVAYKLRTEPIDYPDGMPIHQIRRRLKKVHEFDTMAGDRLSMIDKLLEVAVEECDNFRNTIVSGYGHYCEAHQDCHGLTCGLVFSQGFQRHLVKLDIRLDSCDNKLQITVHNETRTIATTNQTIVLGVEVSKIQNTELVFDLETTVSGGMISITLTGALCVSTHYSCFEDVEILHELPLDITNKQCYNNNQNHDPYIDRVYHMTLPDILEEVSEFGLDMRHCLIVINEIRNATLYALMTKESSDGIHGDGFQEKEDFCFESGPIPLAHLDIQIIPPNPPPGPGMTFLFMVGPIPFHFAFGASARIGVDIDLGMCLMSMKAKAIVTPHLGATVWGELALDIFIAYGGIRLEGHLMETRFPITAEFGFGKFPINIGFRLDLELIPLELRLKAFAKVRAIFFTITVFDACIWKYKTPTFKFNLFNIPYNKNDPTPIKTSSSAHDPRQRRSSQGNDGCEVKQIEGRDITDTAFLLEFSAKSDVSEITLTYAIGTHRSGNNVQDWTGMSGNSLTAPVTLNKEHYGIPLYFTIKAKNSQGTEAIAQCQLVTFDNTLPDGRIDESYQYTSHPYKISGKVIVFDDSELVETHSEGVGYSTGQSGVEVIPWTPLRLHAKSERTTSDRNSQLRFFTIGKEGRLTAETIASSKTNDEEGCALMCKTFGNKCVSFDYEHHSETCDLQSVVEGPNAEVRLSGTYKHYERLDVGNSSYIEHNLDLKHGTRYFINAEIRNTLGYRGYISSHGTMADFTPPEPGLVGNTSLDRKLFDGCKAAIIQRCVEITSLPNHRKIIDGLGSNTVFNGHEGGVDTLYTLANHFMSGNWDGFHDDETGIYGYTWAVGTSVCGTDIANYSDPHAHLSSRKFWTNTGFARNLHLPDGPYYVTVQAINNVVHGGAMVTTVCHSTPIMVDTTPPIFTRGITDNDIVFDEDFNLMALYFSAMDPKSKIKTIDFGLGLTKHDVDVRGYSTFEYKKNQTFIVVKDLNLASGEPVWIRLQAKNNVELPTTAHSDNPILIDRTKPVAGIVLDGNNMGEDLKYQSDNTQLCTQWKRFYDPESGIEEYRWAVGSSQGKDDIVPFKDKTFSRDIKEACTSLQLQHNSTYYSTIRAKNSALNPKYVEGYSNGVLIDVTQPVKGWIKDGNDENEDINFSSETAEVAAVWGGFSDPESGIVSYNLDVYINNVASQFFDNGLKTRFIDYSLSMKHGDKVFLELTATNGAGTKTSVQSNGFVIDQTPPVVKYLYDTVDGKRYQSDSTKLHLKWEFSDPESGLKEYRYYVEDFHQGQGHKLYPIDKDHVILNNNVTADVVLKNLNLESGHKYSVTVTAINHAGMPQSQQSEGVMVDSTPPVLKKVHLGLVTEPEEVNDGFIEHDDQHSMTLTWDSYDFESGIFKSYVAIGTSPTDNSITNGKFLEFGADRKAVINDLDLKPSNGNESDYYYIQVKVQNGAGMYSIIGNLSFPIKVLKENIPGTIFDGRNDLEDADYTYDKTSIAMSFVGFESEQCSIVGYEWAVGSKPFYYDVLPFTDYGIVLMNDTYGRGQIHKQLYEGSTYYITVRARTGHMCKEEYILSCSDGITVDTTPPEITQITFGREKIHLDAITTSLYINRTDSVDYRWESKDPSGIATNWWSFGSLPGNDDIHPKTPTQENYIPAGRITLKHGQTFFLNTGAIDKAGNEKVVSLPSVTIDTTKPEIIDLSCTPYISVLQSRIKCQWGMVKEYESTLQNFTIGIGSQETKTDISSFHRQPIYKRSWTRNILDNIKNTNLSEIYIIFQLENPIGMKRNVPVKVVIDRTSPTGGKVDIVTNIDLNGPIIKQYCQIPQSFVEFTIDGWKDDEAGIDRYEAAIGSLGRISNIKDFSPISNTDKILMTHLSMAEGSDVRVTVRAYNKAGLYNQVTSDLVIISLFPKLLVNDGSGNDDEDYQTALNTIQGHWKYSDNCKIKSAEWSIEDITGNVVQSFQPLSMASSHFYSDTLNLTNGRTYINIIRTIDALNRTRLSRSDGLAVKIEPPIPGTVRDGEANDQTYQESIHELSVNWDPFGNTKSRDPTQKIKKYEVAIGTDRRNSQTRSNVHYFVDVGLNTSYIFRNLNLTAKTINYYMTVRGYSYAGSYQEESSNGIKVGYHDEIYPGIIEHNSVQPYTDKLYVSWSGFQADMGVDKFRIAVSTFVPTQLPNITLNCKMYDNKLPDFDVISLRDVGKDTFKELTNLTLLHAHKYYVTVIVTDTSGRCIGSHGPSVMIDTTPPEAGELILPGGIGPNVAFVFDSRRLGISWTKFDDPESPVHRYEVKLLSGSTCFDSGEIPSENGIYSVIRSTEVTDDLHTVFYDLQLSPTFTYVITVTAQNEAGLTTTIRSRPILLDTTPPVPGVVKVGTDWTSNIKFQASIDDIQGMIGIAHTEKASECLRQDQVFPDSGSAMEILHLGYDFDSSCVIISEDKLAIYIRHDDQLQNIIKGGIKLSSQKILEGNYSTTIKAAQGDNMITSWFLASSFDGIFSDFTFNPPDNDTGLDMKEIAYSTREIVPTTTYTQITSGIPGTTLYNDPVTSPVDVDSTEETNTEQFDLTTPSDLISQEVTTSLNGSTLSGTFNHHTTIGSTSNPTPRHSLHHMNSSDDGHAVELLEHYGVGFHIPGYQMDGQWYGYIWIRDKYKTISRQIPLKFDPTTTYNEFTVNLEEIVMPVKTSWSISIYLNGETIAQFSGVGLKSKGISGIYTWNKDDYFPPVTDFLTPFIGEAIITSVKIPLPKQDGVKCVHGLPFYDGESKIKELLIGVSDTINNTDSISPMMLYKTFCNHCSKGCNIGCEDHCVDKPPDDFEIIQLSASNLSLSPATVDNTQHNSNTNQLNATTYYLNVKTINFAGQETLVQSKGVMVDTTPPDLQYVRCVDPSSSMDEPTKYQGTNSSIGAYWECSEDVGDIVEYIIQIGTDQGLSDIKPATSVGFSKKLKVDGLELQHQHTYYFTVIAVNSASLKSQKSCNITVEIRPPDVDNVTMSYMFSDDVSHDMTLTSEDKDIGLEWDGGKEDVAFYEWEIGSEPETDDVFPRIKVGITESKQAFIKDGKLWIDNTRLNVSVGDFGNKTVNITEHYDKKTFFHLEPGKCVYLTLYAVGRSHLSSTVRSDPLCVTRKGDTRLDLSIQSRKRKGGLDHGNIQIQDTNTGISADVIIKGRYVKMLAGVLNQTDVTEEYGSAASYKYKRYLIDPRSHQNDTSRFLRNRLKKYAGLMFYLSPSTSLESMTEISINVKFDKSLYDTNTDLPALIYWDKDDEIWKHPHDICSDVKDNTDFLDGIFTIKVCKDIFIKSANRKTRKKRSVNVPTVPVPRMWSLDVMSRRAPNTPPRITTSQLFISEDMRNITIHRNGRTVQTFDSIHDMFGQRIIQYIDDENDTVDFMVTKQPEHGTFNITTDGAIYYVPEENFHGVDFVFIKAVETGLLPPFHPLSFTKNITITVSPMNDAPQILPFESELKFEENDVQGKVVINVLLEGNISKSYDIGHVTFYDVDFTDPNMNEINYTCRMNNTLYANYSFIQTDYRGGYKMRYKLTLSVDKTFNGRTTFYTRGFDRAKFTTKNLEVNTYILISPCIHGNCINRTSIQCDDVERATSFTRYKCDCDVGYTGQWCETDINECDPNPCSVFYDCEDLIGYQKCNLNVAKTFLLTLGVLLILVMCVLLIRRYYRNKRPSKIDPGYNIWNFGSDNLGQKKKIFSRPATAVSTENPSTSRPTTALSIQDITHPTTSRDIDVGIGSLLTDNSTNTLSNADGGFRLFSEKTMEGLSLALKPVSNLTTTIGMTAPHHVSKAKSEKNEPISNPGEVLQPRHQMNGNGKTHEGRETAGKLKKLVTNNKVDKEKSLKTDSDDRPYQTDGKVSIHREKTKSSNPKGNGIDNLIAFEEVDV